VLACLLGEPSSEGSQNLNLNLDDSAELSRSNQGKVIARWGYLLVSSLCFVFWLTEKGLVEAGDCLRMKRKLFNMKMISAAARCK
jgi:hypothetical protein